MIRTQIQNNKWFEWLTKIVEVIGVMFAIAIILLGAYSAITLRVSTATLTTLAKSNEAISRANEADLKAAAHRQALLSQILQDIHARLPRRPALGHGGPAQSPLLGSASRT